MNNNPEQYKKVRYEHLRKRIDVFKPSWYKNGVIQYKTDRIAILQRKWGMQVEFIIAFDDLTKEGYRLMAIDEGKSGGRFIWWIHWGSKFIFLLSEYEICEVTGTIS